MPYLHKELAAGAWQKLSLAEQLGNIGSEISRARSWEKVDNIDSRNKALARALELVDLTLKDENRLSSLKELARLREVISDNLIKNQQYNIYLEALEKYCLDFALVARLGR